jgi:serine/threonine-protein kinase
VTGSAADIFVSYKAEDRSRLAPLVDALEAEGFSVWWDARISGGSNWRHDIEEHLEAAKCVLVAWTKHSVGREGEFVRDEAGQARKRGTYLPVRLDQVDLPLGFREVQAVSLRGWHGDRFDPRFLALVSAVREQLTGLRPEHPHASRLDPRISRRGVIGGALAGVALLGLGGWAWLRSSAASAAGSIAVLPFENLSGDPSQAYFSDGLAEELRSALARIPQLKVVARTSSEAVRNDDARTAAQKLGVANILTGSVRRSPQLIRVDAQLVDGHTGLERWSQTFDRPLGDVLAIQTNIAENVADALSIQLAGAAKAALTLGGTSVPAALDLFLQAGRGKGGPEGMLRSIAQLDAAIQLDPNYAQAYAEKAAALSTYGGTYARSLAEKASFLDQAITAAKRAIQIAPKLPEGHTALSYVYRNQLRLKDADREIGIAVRLPGATAETWSSYGVALSQKSRGTEVLGAVTRATQLDPLNAGVFTGKAWTLFALHQYPSAIAAAQEALRIEPSLAGARRYLGYSLIMMHRYDEASAELSKLPKDNVQAQAARAMVAAAKGDLKT